MMLRLLEAERDALAGLLATSPDGLSASDVVEAARPAHHPLHRRFEWDDRKAAAKYRLERAREVLESFRIVIASSQRRDVQMSIVPGAVSSGSGYRAIEVVMADGAASRKQLEAEWARVDSALARFASIAGLRDEYGDLVKLAERTRERGKKLLEAREPVEAS